MCQAYVGSGHACSTVPAERLSVNARGRLLLALPVYQERAEFTISADRDARRARRQG